MAAPPEVLQWARSALNGLTSIENKARWKGLQADPEVWDALHKIEQDLIAFLETHKSKNPEKWVSSE
jgi:hypothetical protein